MARVPALVRVEEGTALPVEGRLRTLITAPNSRTEVAGDVITVRGPTDRVAQQAQSLLKALARDRCTSALDHYAGRLELPYAGLSLRDTRGRWGSCTHKGAIMLSWRLIMAPAPVLRYVAAHEVAHLAHFDHSPAYWRTVDQLFPGWERQRDWLKANGSELHRYRF
jgi:predicted metal-dependent hydrolase